MAELKEGCNGLLGQLVDFQDVYERTEALDTCVASLHEKLANADILLDLALRTSFMRSYKYKHKVQGITAELRPLLSRLERLVVLQLEEAVRSHGQEISLTREAQRRASADVAATQDELRRALHDLEVSHVSQTLPDDPAREVKHSPPATPAPAKKHPLENTYAPQPDFDPASLTLSELHQREGQEKDRERQLEAEQKATAAAAERKEQKRIADEVAQKTFQEFTLAAAQGDKEAMHGLAVLLEEGVGM